MENRYKVVKVCPIEYESVYPECTENKIYPNLVKYIQTNNEFEVFIVNEKTGNYWLAEQFFYVKRNIKSFTTEETPIEEEING